MESKAQRMAEKIVERFAEDRKQIGLRISPQHVNRASDVGHPCARYLTYKRTNWQDALPFHEQFGWSVSEGKHQENIVTADLLRLGFVRVEAQQAFEWPEYELTGHIEGCLVDTSDDPDGEFPVAFELKALTTYAPKLESISDLMKTFWTKRYLAQFGLYLLMKEVEEGVFIVKDRNSGRLYPVAVNIFSDDEDGKLLRKETDAALDRCKVVNESVARWRELSSDNIEKWEPPDRIPYDGDTCGSCRFRHLCLPAQHFGDGLKKLDVNDEVFDSLVAYDNTLTAHKIHEAAKRKLKKRFDGVPVGEYYLKNEKQVWSLTAKESHRKGYTVAPSTSVSVKFAPLTLIEEENEDEKIA